MTKRLPLGYTDAGDHVSVYVHKDTHLLRKISYSRYHWLRDKLYLLSNGQLIRGNKTYCQARYIKTPDFNGRVSTLVRYFSFSRRGMIYPYKGEGPRRLIYLNCFTGELVEMEKAK